MNPRYAFFLAILIAAFFLPGPMVSSQEKAPPEEIAPRGYPVPPKIEYRGKEDELSRLLQLRYEAALRGLDAVVQQYKAGHLGAGVGSGEMGRAVQRVASAGLELDTAPQSRLKMLEFKFDFWKAAEFAAKQRFDAGASVRSDLDLAQYMRYDAEIELLRAKREGQAKPPAGKSK